MNHVFTSSARSRGAWLLALLVFASGCDARAGHRGPRAEDAVASIMTATSVERDTYVTSPSAVIPGLHAQRSSPPRLARDGCQPASREEDARRAQCIADAARVGDDANLATYLPR